MADDDGEAVELKPGALLSLMIREGARIMGALYMVHVKLTQAILTSGRFGRTIHSWIWDSKSPGRGLA